MQRLLTMFEAARLLRITTPELCDLLLAGTVPFVALPTGQVRFDVAEMRIWAATLRHPARQHQTITS